MPLRFVESVDQVVVYSSVAIENIPSAGTSA
jgi:hypothetical protein